jgi:hypothetical protein
MGGGEGWWVRPEYSILLQNLIEQNCGKRVFVSRLTTAFSRVGGTFLTPSRLAKSAPDGGFAAESLFKL